MQLAKEGRRRMDATQWKLTEWGGGENSAADIVNQHLLLLFSRIISFFTAESRRKWLSICTEVPLLLPFLSLFLLLLFFFAPKNWVTAWNSRFLSSPFFLHTPLPFPFFPQEKWQPPSAFFCPPPFFSATKFVKPECVLCHILREKGVCLWRDFGGRCIKRRVWMKLNRKEKCFVEAYYIQQLFSFVTANSVWREKTWLGDVFWRKKGLRLFSLYGRKSR